MLIYDVSFSFVYAVVRWTIFMQFAAAFVASCMTCFAVQRLMSRNASRISPA